MVPKISLFHYFKLWPNDREVTIAMVQVSRFEQFFKNSKCPTVPVNSVILAGNSAFQAFWQEIEYWWYKVVTENGYPGIY